MNTPVIVDTSGLISLVSSTDSNHARALAASDRLMAATSVGQRLITSGEFVVVETTPALRATTLNRFSSLPGGVSLTDCFVMAVADLFQTKEIFGFDDAFRKNGYRLPATVAERESAA